jgi:hypothetical protein
MAAAWAGTGTAELLNEASSRASALTCSTVLTAGP